LAFSAGVSFVCRLRLGAAFFQGAVLSPARLEDWRVADLPVEFFFVDFLRGVAIRYSIRRTHLGPVSRVMNAGSRPALPSLPSLGRYPRARL